ncbi:unnamed protein product, partial [Heterosigma akashiwo]
MVLFIIVFAFSSAFHSLEIWGGTYGDSMINTFFMMLGNFAQSDFESSAHREVATILFCVYMFLSVIVMFNLLIAILSDTFARIMSKAEANFQKELLITILENEFFIPRRSPRRAALQAPYLHILCSEATARQMTEA